MAKFEVYELNGRQLVLDCQADLLQHLDTRFVVPLLTMEEAPRPAARLNPVLKVQGIEMIMLTQQAAAVPARLLGDPIASVSAQQNAVGNALDMLICGF